MYLMKFLKKIPHSQEHLDFSLPIYVYANRKNAGDFLSARGVKTAVGIEGTDLLIEDNHLQVFLKHHGEKKAKMIIGGGGLLKDTFQPFWEMILSSKARYFIFGVGVCDIKTKGSLLPDEVFRNVILKAKAVYVRDSWTSSLIETKFGIKVHQILCPSILDIYSRFQCCQKRWPKQPKLLYVHHKKLIQLSNHSEYFVRDIVKNICTMNKFIFLEVDNICRNPDILLQQYIHADFIISTRLHGCVFSYALNKPFIAISADHKIDSFVHDYCNSSVLDINKLSLDSLNDIIHFGLSIPPRKDDFSLHLDTIKRAGETTQRLFRGA